MLLEGVRIGGWDAANGSEIFFDASLLEASFDEVLGGADECARLSADGGFKGGEVAAGFGGHEHDGLLGLGGNGNEGALLADLGVPGLNAIEPVFGRGIGGATQEDADEEVFDGLGRR